MEEQLRTAVVGCGYHGAALAQAVLRTDGLRLVACADPDQDAARAVADLAPGVVKHADVHELLATDEVDLVLVATTHDALAPVTLATVRAGRHVMVEKPMALNDEEAKEVEFAAASAGVTCMVGYSFRFGMAQHVRRLLDDGVIGSVRAVVGTISTGAMDDDQDWVSRADRGGGPMLYVGCHLVDLAVWFMGEEPTGVAATVRERGATGVDLVSALTLEFPDDRLAQLLVTQSAPGFFYEVRVIGSAGLISLRGRSFVQYEVEVHSDVHAAYAEPTTIRPATRGDHIGMMLVPELIELEAAVRAGRAPAVTAGTGRTVLRVIDAAKRSAREQRTVSLERALSAH